MSLSFKQKIIAAATIIGAVLILIFKQGLYSSPSHSSPKLQQQNISVAPEYGKIISTNPEALDNAIILPTQDIEITFNLPLENKDELKHKIEPAVGYTIKLSDDKKTAKIIPTSTFALGTTYTLFIYKNDTKFDGGKKLDRDYNYHFKTIEYKGV